MNDINNHAVITGAAGFLGRHVARGLSNSGWRVSGIGLGKLTQAEKKETGLTTWYPAEVNIKTLTQLIKSEGLPDLVFHGAGGASVAESWEAPLTDFENTVVTAAAVIELLRRHAPESKIIYPSSAAVYGNVGPERIKENSILAPMSPYGSHKLMVERMLVDAQRLYGLQATIIRFFSLFGPGLQKQLIWDVIQRLNKDPEVLCLDGDGTETRDFLYVEDAARLVVHFARASAKEPIIINGGCGKKISVAKAAGYLITAAGKDSKTRIEFSGRKRKGDPESLVADTAKLESFGFQPEFRFEDGIDRLLIWTASTGYA